MNRGCRRLALVAAGTLAAKTIAWSQWIMGWRIVVRGDSIRFFR
ncbi:MAG: hypothetical protein ABL878_06925 [Burkholderiales bacterium]